MSFHNKFISGFNDGTSTNSSSTFIIDSGSKIRSIDITASDEFITLPDPDSVEYDAIQYRKKINTVRDIVFTYNGRQKGKLYFHRNQTIIFHKFKPLTGNDLTWIT